MECGIVLTVNDSKVPRILRSRKRLVIPDNLYARHSRSTTVSVCVWRNRNLSPPDRDGVSSCQKSSMSTQKRYPTKPEYEMFKKLMLCVVACSFVFVVSGVAEAGNNCNSCCEQPKCKLPKISLPKCKLPKIKLPKLKCCKPKCDPCAPVCAAPVCCEPACGAAPSCGESGCGGAGCGVSGHPVAAPAEAAAPAPAPVEAAPAEAAPSPSAAEAK